VVDNIESVAELFPKLKFKSRSYWNNKANFFSLFVALYSAIEDKEDINVEMLMENLAAFELNIPEDYKLAATEGVNNTAERLLRHSYLMELIKKSV
jgi:hypothetical protein